ncbi:hypothetical protein [Pseudoponticoccus marisrubri]|uniref:Uncharacterized protein n=1 Tax=Pseudoponticoccus marisrubri TaxID=1685382 RepID=A0A0W7WNT7_9RHOB|nr:hypothetical protein [Pseudoponticoccus marisrubri]KUF12258.1 hypothetical protein AVJ23_00540 [Pseudoponticoccus marisrubri]
MRRASLTILATLLASLWAAPREAAADARCDTLLEMFRAEPPALASPLARKGAFGCTLVELQMLRVNANAVADAWPVTEARQLHGYWLGDDVLDYVEGRRTPGQELLVFGPDETPGVVTLTQYWLKAAVPFWTGPLWSTEGRYRGRVAQGRLTRDDAGQWSDDPFEPTLRYDGRQLEYSRASDLWTKTRINHFEFEITLRRADDTLVLESRHRDPRTNSFSQNVTTYTRVAPGAARDALALVAALEISQARNFDCLAHQLSEGQGPLFDVLAVDEVTALLQMARQMVALEAEEAALREARRLARDTETRAALRDQYIELAERKIALAKSDPQARLGLQVVGRIDEICPWPDE